MAVTQQLSDQLGATIKSDLPRFECCFCRSLQHEPVLLDCLHIYCRLCIESKSHVIYMLKTIVTCCICSEVTELNDVTTNSVVLAYQQSSVLLCESVPCNACDAEGEPAEFWCVDCCKGLCGSCISTHNLFTKRHRCAELEVARTWSFSQLTRTRSQCSKHMRQMETHCFVCREPKCPDCCTMCRAMGHDMQPLSHDKTQQYLCGVIDVVQCTEKRLNLLLSGVKQRRLEIIRRLWEVRTAGCHLLRKRLNRLQESKVDPYNRSVSEVCVNLERIWCQCPEDWERAVWLRCAKHIEVLSLSALQSIHHLGSGRLLLKATARRSTSSCGASIRRLRQSWKQSGESIGIGGSAPLTADIVLSGCLGAIGHKRAGPRAPLLFAQASVSFQPPVYCPDLAATRHGHVLLAAREHGLLVYSDRGQQLSGWRPAKRSDGRADEVTCVAELSDRRAVVGVVYAQLVVMLRCSQADDTWLEHRRVAVLPSPPARLAAYGDLLAVAEGRLNGQHGWEPRRHVKLLRLSSGQLLYTQSRDYDIRRVSLTALCIVTTSRDPVMRNSGAKPYVLDAFSHSGEFVWRYETSYDELVDCLCVSADAWSRAYVSVVKRDWSSSRVMAIGGADGKDRRDVLSSTTHGLQIPVWLSLASEPQRTILAVVSWDAEPGATIPYLNVALYEAKIERQEL